MRETHRLLLPPEALRDIHTKAYNHPLFHYLLEWQMRRAVRYQESFALLCVALDASRNEAGNEDQRTDLEIAAENIQREIRQTDLIGRNSETLIVLLLYVGNGDAAKVAERIRVQIEHYAFPGRSPDEPIHRTVSMGGAACPMDAVESSSLMQHALSRLGRAQEKGGNRVVLSGGAN